jgi:hypothetical protein
MKEIHRNNTTIKRKKNYDIQLGDQKETEVTTAPGGVLTTRPTSDC